MTTSFTVSSIDPIIFNLKIKKWSVVVDGGFDSKIAKLEQVSKVKRIQLNENVIAIPFEADFMRKNKLWYCFTVPVVNCKVGYKKHGSKDIQGLDEGCPGLYVVDHIVGHDRKGRKGEEWQ